MPPTTVTLRTGFAGACQVRTFQQEGWNLQIHCKKKLGADGSCLARAPVTLMISQGEP